MVENDSDGRMNESHLTIHACPTLTCWWRSGVCVAYTEITLNTSLETNSQVHCVLQWEFFGDLLTYTFLESADLGDSKIQCCHLHRHLHGGHFGISKRAP